MAAVTAGLDWNELGYRHKVVPVLDSIRIHKVDAGVVVKKKWDEKEEKREDQDKEEWSIMMI